MKRVVFLAAAAATLVQFTKYDLTALQTLGCEIHMVCNMQEGNISQAALQFLFRDKRRSCYHDVYYIRIPFSLQDCTMQESEVQDLRLVTRKELLDLLEQMSHRSPNYKRRLTEFLSHRS